MLFGSLHLDDQAVRLAYHRISILLLFLKNSLPRLSPVLFTRSSWKRLAKICSFQKKVTYLKCPLISTKVEMNRRLTSSMRRWVKIFLRMAQYAMNSTSEGLFLKISPLRSTLLKVEQDQREWDNDEILREINNFYSYGSGSENPWLEWISSPSWEESSRSP